MFSTIRSSQYVAIRTPSDKIRVEQLLPNTTINLGKFGSFNTNSIIGRPFYLTFEILDKASQQDGQQLRVLKAAELHADTLLEEAESELQDGATPNPEFDEYGLLSIEKSNQAIYDNPENQKLTMAEIEALKSSESGSAKDTIAKILASHSQLDQKTAFSLAKYVLRKQRKFMKRFTVLPLDVATLTDWMMDERDASKIMEIRNEMLALLTSWANVHAAPMTPQPEKDAIGPQSRYLVVDDTGGIVVAAIAERMGLLNHLAQTPVPPDGAESEAQSQVAASERAKSGEHKSLQDKTFRPKTSLHRNKQHYRQQLATSNTMTLIHSNQQPNLNLLRYFNFDPSVSPAPSSIDPHPLHSHLKTLTWLQLLEPESDSLYSQPGFKTPEEIQAMKTNARSNYFRKRRRWERCKSIVDEARAGGFDALIVASFTDPISIIHRLVPLLTGGAQIVIYSPHIAPLYSLIDAYSVGRRTAFLKLDEEQRKEMLGSDEFPLDPTLTLGFMVQTARVKKWQVLPGRTHPLMMARGGAEGYLASATRVLPVSGKVEARGKGKRRGVKRVAGTDVVINGDDDSIESSDGDDYDEIGEGDRKKIKIEDETLLAQESRIDQMSQDIAS